VSGMGVELPSSKEEVDLQLTIDQANSWTWLSTARFKGGETSEESSDPANGDGTETETSEEKPTTPPAETGKTFTQEEVNALVTRETQKAARGKLDPKEAGFASKDDLKVFLQKMKDKEEADKTEDEKAKEQAIKEAVEAARNEVLSTANSRLVKAEFTISANRAGVVIPIDDAFQVAQTLEEYSPEVDEEKGTVSGFDDDFFKAFRNAKPYVFAKPAGQDIGVGAGGGGNNKEAARETELKELYPSLGRQLSANEVSGIRPRR
jgi:hypothetical protein